ncbi:MAG: NAD-dependent epimerase/dehydratase family protein [Gammaproteobacteria bacterium]|nr:NAD-dependent epimerase/dehydratase family protein [Gammaproteobacteria bacterium]
MTSNKTILVIGGTGHFGGRICRRLLGEPNTNLVVTSRNVSSAQNFANELGRIAPDYKITAESLDQSSDSFERDLEKIAPDIVVHTAGPYQGQSYRVAEACIATKCHYIDLADGRDFVEGFSQLDNQAKTADVLVVSGASTLPGLSSAVTDHYRDEFQMISSINISIAPAHQTPRGPGTISAVLSYCGKPFDVLENGIQATRYGWQDLRWQHYPELGKRLSGACDVPDLSILPVYLPDIQTVTFHAALEARWEQIALWSMGWLSRFGLIANWSPLVPLFNYISEKLIRLGSDKGGMHIHLSGIGKDGAPKDVKWFLTARNNHGPEIPCTPAIILARKLAQEEIGVRGALPCLGLISLEDFDHEVESFEISWQADS